MKNGEQCAFPADSKTQTDGGLTKREYFAGLAMQSFIQEYSGIVKEELIIKYSIDIADELLKQLDK